MYKKLVQYKAGDATPRTVYKPGGDPEAEGPGKAFWGQRIWPHSQIRRGPESEKKTAASWGTRVWKNRLYVNKERDCSKGLGSPPLNAVAQSLHSFFPFQKQQHWTKTNTNSTFDEPTRRGTVNTKEEWRPEAEREYHWAAISEAARKVPDSVRSTVKRTESKPLVLNNTGCKILSLSLPGSCFVPRSRRGWAEYGATQTRHVHREQSPEWRKTPPSILISSLKQPPTNYK